MKELIGYMMLATSVFAASNFEFSKGIDLTGRTNVSTSQLNQLIDNATPAIRRGLVLTTNNTPDTTTYPYFTNYVWRDISTDPPTMKFYSTAGWVSAAVAPGSVVRVSIADGAIDASKITNSAVDTAELANNAVTADKIATDAVNQDKISAGAVGRDEIAIGAVTSTSVTNGGLVGLNIAVGTLSNMHLLDNTIMSNKVAPQGLHATNIANGTVDSNQLAVAGINATNIAAGASGTVLVSQGSSAPSWETNYILQIVTTNTLETNLTASVSAIAYNAAPTDATTVSTKLVVTITPKSATSKLKMDYTVNCGADFGSSPGGLGIAIFDNTTLVYVSPIVNFDAYNTEHAQYAASGSFIMNSPGVASAKNYHVKVFPVVSAAKLAINAKYDGTPLFGGSIVSSSFSVTEIR